MNSGQFSPREALWADGWFDRWCKALHLQSRDATAGSHVEQEGFVVDLDATDGLIRATTTAAGNSLFLDSSPLMALIDEELKSLPDSDTLYGELAPAARAGKVALLTKTQNYFRPRSRPLCAPRGARTCCRFSPGGRRSVQHHPRRARRRRVACQCRVDV